MNKLFTWIKKLMNLLKTLFLTHFYIVFTLINNNKKVIFLFLLGAIQIMGILFARFRTRDIQDLPIIFDFFRAILYTSLTFAYSIALLVLIYGFIKKKNVTTNPKWMEWVIIGKLKNLADLYYVPMKAVYQQIFNIRIRPSTRKIVTKIQWIFIDVRRKHIWIHLIFVVLCPIIPAIFLTIDVFYFYQLDWFYKSLILMFCPTMMRVILYMLEDYCVPDMIELGKHVMKVTETEDEVHYIKKDKNMTLEEFDYWIGYYYSCNELYNYITDFRKFDLTWYSKLGRCIQLGLFITSWGYLAYTQLILV